MTMDVVIQCFLEKQKSILLWAAHAISRISRLRCWEQEIMKEQLQQVSKSASRLAKLLEDEIGGTGRGCEGLLMKAATQAVAAVLAKVAIHKAAAIFETSPSSCSSRPDEQAAGVVGLLLVMAGVMLQEKRPSLAKAMLKLGGVAVAFALLLPVAGTFPPAMASVFGVVAAAIVVLTAALA